MISFKKVVLSIGSILLAGLTACGSLPTEFPEIEQESEQIDTGDRFQVNFFFQNNENTYCISPDGDAYNFFSALSQTFSIMSYSELSKTYTLSYNDDEKAYSIAEYDRNLYHNMTWEDARKEYAYSGSYADTADSFYVLDSNYDITMESRLDGGFLNLYLDEVKAQNVVRSDGKTSVDTATDVTALSEETTQETADDAEAAEESDATAEETSFFNPDAINVMFTDLSEKNITYLGEELRNYYTADQRYNACIMAVKLEMEPNYTIYYASKDNANSLTKNVSGDSRWFYLIMTGPTTDLATFVQNLTVHMNEVNLKEGNESGGYELSDLNFTSENFDAEADLRIETLDAADETQIEIQSESGDDGLFENCLVRLSPVTGSDSIFSVGTYRDEILEYRYDSAEKEFGLKGYQDTSTKDFALNIYLEKEIEARDLVAQSTDLCYVFGDPTIYYPDGDQWVEMDADHQERFFHTISIGEDEEEGTHFTLIGDNSDECGVHSIYITVPILQRATVSNTVSDAEDSTTTWVLDECTFNSSDTRQEVKRTYYFDKFYMNLFDLQIADSRDAEGNLYTETKDVYSQIDVLKILIEDIH